MVAVVLFHSGVLPGGYTGVDVFFVLSGHLIVGLLAVEAATTGTLDLRRFFSRRVRRLLPALAVTTSVTLLAAVAFVPVGRFLTAVADTGIGAATFRANLVLAQADGYFTPSAETNPLLHTWSLSVEEQFYAVLPVLVVLLAASPALRNRTRGGELAVIAAAGTLLTIGAVATATGGLLVVGGDAFYSPVTRALQFGIGAASAMVYRHRRPAPSRLLASVGLLLLLLSFGPLTAHSPFPDPRAALPVLGTVLLLLWGPLPVLERRPAIRLGDLSYSWYLWHWPFIALAGWVGWDHGIRLGLIVTVSLFVAIWSYQRVENPFRTESRGAVAWILVLSIAVPTALGLGVRTTASVAEARAEEIHPGLAAYRGDAAAVYGPADNEAVATIAIVGDSHAEALTAGLGPELAADGLRVVNLSRAGCLFLLETRQTGSNCDEYVDETKDALRAASPDVVLVHGYYSGRLADDRFGDSKRIDIANAEKRADTVQEGLAMYEEQLLTTIQWLDDLGSDVVIVSSVPDFPSVPTPTLLELLLNTGIPEPIARETVEERTRGPAAVEEAVANITGSRVVDPVPALCSRMECSQLAPDGTLLFFDASHVTPAGARRLVPLVMSAIADSPA